MKRKLFALLLILVMLPVLLFADLPSEKEYLTDRSHSFQPYSLMSPRVVGMGGAGLALQGTMENRLMNPANSAGYFGLSLPYVSLAVYNIQNNINRLEEVYRENGKVGLYDVAFSLLNSVPSGERNFMSADMGAGLSLRNISVFGFMNVDVFTFGSGDLSSTIGLDMDMGLTTTLSYDYDFGNDYRLSVGLGFSVLTKNITASSEKLDGIGVDFVSNVFEEYQNDPESLGDALFAALVKKPVSIGNAYPISVGLRADMPYGFSLALALNNMNGKYNMVVSNDNQEYVIDVPMTLDFGFGWNLEVGDMWYYLLEPSIAIDIVDIVGMFQDGIFQKGIFVDHLKMGAELNFLTVFNARCGLDRGYFTFGFGMDMYALNVDLSYGVRPYGPSREGRYLDYVKLRINLGYDRP